MLSPWKKSCVNLENILKSRDISLPIKVYLIKAMVFPVVMYGCESWTINKDEHRRIDAFELWCWRRLLTVPWHAGRCNRSILKEINPEYSLEGPMLKLKLQYFGHLMQRADIRKDPEDGKDWRQEEKGMTEDKMVGWHHWLNGHEFEQAPGVGKGQGSLACCSPWGCKESNMTEWLNNSKKMLVDVCPVPFCWPWFHYNLVVRCQLTNPLHHRLLAVCSQKAVPYSSDLQTSTQYSLDKCCFAVRKASWKYDWALGSHWLETGPVSVCKVSDKVGLGC